MASQIHLNFSKADTQKTSHSCEKTLQRALADRARFLAAHPRHIAYKRNINRILSKAGTPENRLAVLSVMMECKLSELNHHCQSLGRMLNTGIVRGCSKQLHEMSGKNHF